MRSGRDEILAELRGGKGLIFVHQEPGLLSTAFEVVDHREVNPCPVQVRALSCLRRHE